MEVVKNDKQLVQEVKLEVKNSLGKITGVENSASFVMINDGTTSGSAGHGKFSDLVLGVVTCMEGDDVVADVMCNAVINYYRDKERAENLSRFIGHLQELQ